MYIPWTNHHLPINNEAIIYIYIDILSVINIVQKVQVAGYS